MDLKNLEIPERPGSTLTIPPLSEYGKLVESSRALGKEAVIDGAPMPDLAQEARQVTLKLAREYTESLGFDPGPNANPAAPIIGSGHQPFLFHSGIAIKHFALARSAERLGATPIFFSVDSDEFKNAEIPVPSVEEKLIKTANPLFPQSHETIFESADPGDSAGLIKKLANLSGSMGNPILKKPREALERFISRMDKAPLRDDNFTAAMISARRAWEAPVLKQGLLEAPVSLLSGSAPFLRFAADLIGRIDQFSEIYNSELARYRKERKLRYPANPFPDLAEHSGLMETPFWIIKGAARDKLFARNASGETFLFTQDGGQRSMEDLKSGAIAIRPRAIVLSIYLRLFVCDLFIHGIGGAKYDSITDKIISKFYGIEPPPYACVSGTADIGIDIADPSGEIAGVRETIREIGQHPEKSICEDVKFAELAEEKIRLIESIKTKSADKKTLGARISTLNKEMSLFLEPEKEKLETRLEKLKLDEEEFLAAVDRNYPFFFYDPAEVMSMLEQR